MGKAEERALEAYPIVMSQHSDNCKEYDSNESDRLTFIEGYHQAEKDLELAREEIFNKMKFYIESMVSDITFSDINGNDNYDLNKFIDDLKQAMKDE